MRHRWIRSADPADAREPEKQKGPDPLGMPGLDVIEWRVSALCASLARGHSILMIQRHERTLAADGVPFIHRIGGKRVPAQRPHDRALTREGQRARGEVALGVHDGLFSVRWRCG